MKRRVTEVLGSDDGGKTCYFRARKIGKQWLCEAWGGSPCEEVAITKTKAEAKKTLLSWGAARLYECYA